MFNISDQETSKIGRTVVFADQNASVGSDTMLENIS